MSEPVDTSQYQFINFPGKIHLITSDRQLEVFANQMTSPGILGFDTETRPSFKKGEFYKVALIQLATESDAFLIRLHSITKFENIKALFENEQITKVGVAIRDDLKSLQKIFKFTPRGFIELQDVAKEKGLKNMGLKGMTEEVLQSRLSKKAKTTNWEAPSLTAQQIMYAATDAWVGLKLFEKIR